MESQFAFFIEAELQIYLLVKYVKSAGITDKSYYQSQRPSHAPISENASNSIYNSLRYPQSRPRLSTTKNLFLKEGLYLKIRQSLVNMETASHTCNGTYYGLFPKYFVG